MAGHFKYFAFISYSHADERWSRWLHQALETYRVPKRLVGRAARHGHVPGRLTPIFRDRDELTGAADLSSSVKAALRASRHLIVICSPAAARSRWVDEEVRTFKQLGRGDRILTLVVDGEPNATDRPGDEQRECFAASLRFELEQDGSLSTRPAQPIAADLRPGKDGKSNAKLKLVSALLGIGFDDLKQREQRRQQKRLLLITAASVAGMLLTGTLAVTAWMSRQDAMRNRDQAEDLIGFMLGDFRGQLEPLGKLELLKNVGDKAMAYFSSLSDRDLTVGSLLRRAEALRQIGDVRLSLGEFGPALAAFQESLALSQELSQRSPDNQDWLFALGNAWFWVGNTHWQEGDLDASVAPMGEYLKAAERLVQLGPDNAKWQLEQGYAFGSLGSLAAAKGEGAAAIKYFEASNAITEKLIKDEPTDAGLLQNRIENYSWLASTRQELGELREAKNLHARALQLTQELLALNPDDRRIQREEVLRKVFYGRVLLQMGQVAEAKQLSSEALSRARALASLDPENARWQWQLASVMEQEAKALQASGRCKEAVSMADQGLAVTVGLSEVAVGMDNLHLTRLRLLNDKAACLVDAGLWQESQLTLDPVLGQTWARKDTSANATAYENELAKSRHLAGRILASRGSTDEARQLWTAGLGMLDPARTDPDHRATRAMLLQALGRTAEANGISEELASQGFAEHNFTRQMSARNQPH